MKGLKRYGPIVAVVALIAGAVVIFGGGAVTTTTSGRRAPRRRRARTSIRSGPMTPEKAELLGEDVDFGPNCDTELGRIMLESVYAPPCVEPFEGDNGGATSPGVTADTIKVVVVPRRPRARPADRGHRRRAPAPTSTRRPPPRPCRGSPTSTTRLFETYGRKVEVEFYTGTGAGDDTVAAQTDAIAIAEKEPVRRDRRPATGHPRSSPPSSRRGASSAPALRARRCPRARRGVRAVPVEPGPTPDQAAALAAEAIGKLAGPGKAELAGDDEPCSTRTGRTGSCTTRTPTATTPRPSEAYQDELTDNGIELAIDIEFTLDLARHRRTPAPTSPSSRRPASRRSSTRATRSPRRRSPRRPPPRSTSPSGSSGSSVLMDTSIFARRLDHEQWKNGFGISLPAARGERSTNGAFQIWDWAYGGSPPNTYGQRARAAAAHRVHRHPPRRARADARDVPRRPVPLPAHRRRARPRRRSRAATTGSGPTPTGAAPTTSP